MSHLWLLLKIFIIQLAGVKVRFTPVKLLDELGASSIRALLGSFIIDGQNLSSVDELLRYKEYYFGQHYHFPETRRRQIKFSQYISNPNYHEGIFSIHKLVKCPWLAEKIFLHGNFHYEGNILKHPPLTKLQQHKIKFEDHYLWQKVVKYAIDNQMHIMESLDWLVDFIQSCTLDENYWLFKLLVESEQITPEMMQLFFNRYKDYRNNWNSMKGTSELFKFLMTVYLVDSKQLPEDELLSRVTLVRLAASSTPHESSNSIIIRLLAPSTMQSIVKFVWSKEYIELFLRLQCINSTRKDPSFWGTCAALSIRIFSIKGEDLRERKLLEQFIKWAFPHNISPRYSRLVLESYLSSLGNAESIPLEHIPLSHLPPQLHPLKDRHKMWLREGITTAINVAKVENQSQAWGIFTENLLHGIFPISLYYSQGTDDGGSIIFLQDHIISTVQSLLNDETQISGTDCKVSVLLTFYAWLYLLVKRRRMDFSSKNGRKIIKHMHLYFSTREGKGILDNCYLPQFLSLKEIQYLVDSSLVVESNP